MTLPKTEKLSVFNRVAVARGPYCVELLASETNHTTNRTSTCKVLGLALVLGMFLSLSSACQNGDQSDSTVLDSATLVRGEVTVHTQRLRDNRWAAYVYGSFDGVLLLEGDMQPGMTLSDFRYTNHRNGESGLYTIERDLDNPLLFEQLAYYVYFLYALEEGGAIQGQLHQVAYDNNGCDSPASDITATNAGACCDIHDDCYEQYGCSANTSWACTVLPGSPVCLMTDPACVMCNLAAVNCITTCLVTGINCPGPSRCIGAAGAFECGLPQAGDPAQAICTPGEIRWGDWCAGDGVGTTGLGFQECGFDGSHWGPIHCCSGDGVTQTNDQGCTRTCTDSGNGLAWGGWVCPPSVCGECTYRGFNNEANYDLGPDDWCPGEAFPIRNCGRCPETVGVLYPGDPGIWEEWRCVSTAQYMELLGDDDPVERFGAGCSQGAYNFYQFAWQEVESCATECETVMVQFVNNDGQLVYGEELHCVCTTETYTIPVFRLLEPFSPWCF